MSLALQLSAVDVEYDFSSMARQWLKWGALSPKQAALAIWRLQLLGIAHNPETLGLRIGTSDKDREQLSAMAPWQLETAAAMATSEFDEHWGPGPEF
jgi:hypothetical protein